MNRLFAVVAALLAIAAGNGWAQTNAFPVKFRGVIAFSSVPNAVTKLTVNENSLLSSPTNQLLLVVDLTNHDLRLQEVDAGTNVVVLPALMRSRRFAILPDRSFSGAMRFNFDLPPQASGLGVDGHLQVSGRVSVRNGQPHGVAAGVIGVLNDSVSGVNTNLDILLKGKLATDGRPFDGGPLGL